MKLLLLGRNGQVGRALLPLLPQLGEVVSTGREEADFENPAGLAALVEHEKPDVVVNAVAYTAVDAAEDDRERAFRVNAETVGALGRAAREVGALVVHYSTDFVFDGTGSAPHREEDATNPLSVYGESKLAGEVALRESGADHLILRISWIYSEHGKNFPLSILNLAKSRDTLNVVADETGAATSATLVAEATVAALRQATANRDLCGLYHLAPAGVASRHELAKFLVAEARAAGMALKLTSDAIKPIPAAAFPSKVRRPANSALDTSRFRRSFGVTLPPWQD
ncbi:MAG TPA: dTDP-4-dehydrorhamnose reductase, partial [Devosia sp.]|nr:dTDP-4-dehydrorhamnose reductase [Devosia sp.]